ncbi:hypothetical protein [Arthrobacter cheniae]|uniref:hypothetical protein n=1 Tax=Arthrobacter cheniae TaxID=1258888 RepID=UPI0015FF1BA6|nr:hypothetical protein [Arthrobacter cheniae]
MGPPIAQPPSLSFHALVTCTVYRPEASLRMSRRRSAGASLKRNPVAAKIRTRVAYWESIVSAMCSTSAFVRTTPSRVLTLERGARIPLAKFSVRWRWRTAVSSAAESSA